LTGKLTIRLRLLQVKGYKAEHLAIGNRTRGLLAEFGIVVPNRDAALHWVLGDLDAYAELPGEIKELLRSLAEHWLQVRAAMAACDARSEGRAHQDPRCVRLRAVVGVGPLTADAMVASIGNAHEFKNGRQLAAWLGLVPTQHSSGGHARLGAISCRGDVYLRMLLIHGARAVLHSAKLAQKKQQPLDRTRAWALPLAERVGHHKAAVALADKTARWLWAAEHHRRSFNPHHLSTYPAHAVTH
jgi:transposase